MWAIYSITVYVAAYVAAFPALYVLELIAPPRIGELRIDHIGHLGLEPELLTRQLILDGPGRRTRVFFACGEPSNHQLLAMWKRRLLVVHLTGVAARRAYRVVKPIILRSRFHQPFPGAQASWAGGERDHEVMANVRPQLAFTVEEEARGQSELRRIGIPEGAWFVAFHARDPAYYEWLTGHTKRFDRTYRDVPIETMFEAMRWVASLGGYAIRMGAVVESALPDLGPRVIDYATHYRTDFMDVYLCAKARFFVSSTSGLNSVAMIFDVPTGITNLFPYNLVPSGNHTLYIRMFLRDRHTQDILTFPEIKRRNLLECPIDRAQECDTPRYYEDRGLDVIHNDAEDIKNLCMDLMDMVEGRPPHPRAVHLEASNRLLYDGVDRSDLAAKIGPRFSMRHAHLIRPSTDATQVSAASRAVINAV